MMKLSDILNLKYSKKFLYHYLVFRILNRNFPRSLLKWAGNLVLLRSSKNKRGKKTMNMNNIEKHQEYIKSRH